jgi:hypothetical protein
MTIEELTNSIKGQLYDRLSSPYFGAFAAAWIMTNVKFLIVLFSSEDVLSKFVMIELLYPDRKTFLYHIIVYPATSAFLFVLIYPFPAGATYTVWTYYQRFLQHWKQKITSERLLPLEKSQKILSEVRTIAEKYENILDEKDREIEKLKEAITNFTNDEKSPAPQEEKTTKPTKYSVHDLEDFIKSENNDDAIGEFQDILTSVRRTHPAPVSANSIHKALRQGPYKGANSSFDVARIDHLLRKLTEAGAVINTGGRYKLSPLGLEYVVAYSDSDSKI